MIMQTKSHFIFCLLIFKYKTWWIDLCVCTFWTSPAHFNTTVIILITVITLVTIIMIRNVHTITSLVPTACNFEGLVNNKSWPFKKTTPLICPKTRLPVSILFKWGLKVSLLKEPKATSLACRHKRRQLCNLYRPWINYPFLWHC